MAEGCAATQDAERFAGREQQIDELRKRHVKEHYRQLAEANKKGTRVAWSMAGMLPSLLDALGIMACSPENYCTLASAKQMAQKFCAAAEGRGIPHDVCSYGRCMMGMMYQEDGPYGALPRPDLVFVNPATCDAHAVMWQIPAQYFGVPVLRLDGPYFLNGQITQRDIDYRVTQLRDVVTFCEEHLGCKFDLDRFKENTLREHKVRSLLKEIQELRKRVPCPRSTRDMVSEIFYLATIPFSEEAVEYMTLVAEDCRDRVASGIGTGKKQLFRLYYDNIIIWFWLKFYDYLEDRGAVFACDSYTNAQFNGLYAFGRTLDPEQPFESLARRQFYGMVCTGIEPNLDRFEALIRDWRCDGAVIFVNRSCKVATQGRYDKTQMIRNRLGIPILEFEGEMADPLSIDKADVLQRANAFLEALEERASQGAI